jgi:hypothetical protein
VCVCTLIEVDIRRVKPLSVAVLLDLQTFESDSDLHERFFFNFFSPFS